MREHPTLTILLPLAELVRVFSCYPESWTVTVLLATIELLFLSTFTDTGHTQQVLCVCKFISYSALWNAQMRVYEVDSQSEFINTP
jgi:hypothetical protein